MLAEELGGKESKPPNHHHKVAIGCGFSASAYTGYYPNDFLVLHFNKLIHILLALNHSK